LQTNSPLNKEDIAEAVFLFYHVIIPVLTEPSTGVKTGAVLNIRDSNDTWKLNARGGKTTERQYQKLELIAHQQNNALHRFPEVISTWMLRDRAIAPPPGAIRTPADDRFAMTGFTWQQSQSASLWLAQELRRMSLQQAHAIADLCGEGRTYIRYRSRFRVGLNKLGASVI
jgi:hypothetical protein